MVVFDCVGNSYCANITNVSEIIIIVAIETYRSTSTVDCTTREIFCIAIGAKALKQVGTRALAAFLHVIQPYHPFPRMRNITLYTTAILLAIASGTAVLRAQDAELPTMAEPAPLCKEAELRQKLGSCFKSIDGAVDCLSSPTHQEGASKSTIMCFCISTNAELKECLGHCMGALLVEDGMCAAMPKKPEGLDVIHEEPSNSPGAKQSECEVPTPNEEGDEASSSTGTINDGVQNRQDQESSSLHGDDGDRLLENDVVVNVTYVT
eukprot:gene9494-5033_t